MSIELKVGEWYETRGGERVKVLADAREHNPERVSCYECISACTREGHMLTYFPSGGFLDEDEGAISRSEQDLVRHLPGCTGWDWVESKPEVWRDATPEDALREPHLRCRVRSTLSGEWIAGCSLVGYYVSGTVPQWIVNIAGACGTHDFCQVLDE